MQIKITDTSGIANIQRLAHTKCENVKQLKLTCTTGGNAVVLWEIIWQFLMSNIYLPHNMEPFCSCALVFTGALFEKAKDTGEQLKCSLASERENWAITIQQQDEGTHCWHEQEWIWKSMCWVKKADRYRLYAYTDNKILVKTNWGRVTGSRSVWRQGGGRGGWQKGDENVLILVMVSQACVYIYVKLIKLCVLNIYEAHCISIMIP